MKKRIIFSTIFSFFICGSFYVPSYNEICYAGTTSTETAVPAETKTEPTKSYSYDPDTWITATDKPIEQLYYSEKFSDGSEKQVGYRYDAIKGEPNTAITRYTTIYFDNKTDNTKAPYYRIWETYDMKTGKWAERTFDTLVESDKNKNVWGKDIQAFASLQNETIPKMGTLSEAEQKLCIINLGLTDEQCKNLGLTATVSDKERAEAEQKVADGGEITKTQQLADLMNKFIDGGLSDEEIIQIIRFADGDLQALAEAIAMLSNTTQDVAYKILSQAGETETDLLNAFKSMAIGSDTSKDKSSTSEAAASSGTEKDNSSNFSTSTKSKYNIDFEKYTSTSKDSDSNSGNNGVFESSSNSDSNSGNNGVFNKEETNTSSNSNENNDATTNSNTESGTDAPNSDVSKAKQFQ